MSQPLQLRFQLGLGDHPTDLRDDAGLQRLREIGNFRQDAGDAAVGWAPSSVDVFVEAGQAQVPDTIGLIVGVAREFFDKHALASVRMTRSDGDLVIFGAGDAQRIGEFLSFSGPFAHMANIRPWPRKFERIE